MKTVVYENREAEIAVLGSMLLDTVCIEQMRSRLTTDMFYRPETRLMFDALCAVADRNGGSADIVLLRDELKRRGKLADVGGVHGFLESMEETPTSANADYYARIVHECYLRRQMSEHAKVIEGIAADPDLCIGEKIAEVEADFRERVGDEARTPSTGGAMDGIRDMVEATIAGRRKRLCTPWGLLDNLTRALVPGSITLLCGSPGASKSLMLLQAAAHWSDQKIPFAVFELEQSVEFHVMRAVAQQCGVSDLTDSDWIETHPDDTRRHIEAQKGFIESFGSSISASPDVQPTLDQLTAWVQTQARKGRRVICIDPVTAAAHMRGDSWQEDRHFLHAVQRTAAAHGSAILMVTHPAKLCTRPTLDALAGSAAFGRFCQSAIWLESHEEKTSEIRTDCGRDEETHNRTVHILKARGGPGQGLRIAFHFEHDSLTLAEKGLIVQKSKTRRSGVDE